MDIEFHDDESSPIPFLDKIDVEVSTDKGAYLGVVIAAPLSGDVSSQNRLLKKLDGYFAHIQSERSKWREGHDTEMLIRLWVYVHPDSAQVIFELLQRCNSWAEEHNVDFKISTDVAQVKTH